MGSLTIPTTGLEVDVAKATGFVGTASANGSSGAGDPSARVDEAEPREEVAPPAGDVGGTEDRTEEEPDGERSESQSRSRSRSQPRVRSLAGRGGV
eukprot:4382805-Karenia_brevis.AAC.1